MIKIFLDKNEPISSAVEKVIASPDTEIVLVIPKNSQFQESQDAFGLLKREGDVARKNLRVESVDEGILAMAEAAGVPASHSFFQGDQFRRALSDIVVPREGLQDGDGTSGRKIPVRGGKKKKGEAKEEMIQPIVVPPREEELTPISPVLDSRSAPPQTISTPRSFQEENFKEKQSWMRRVRMPWVPRLRIPNVRRRTFFIACTLLLALGVTGWILTAFFARAEIVLDFKKTPWQFDATFVAEKTIGEINASRSAIPGEVFTQKKNVVMLFDASGRKEITKAAKGKILIWNAYSDAPQALVARTRFETPDGKVFRLDKGVTVPGAKKSGGKILPVSIEALVTADAPGTEYNIGPIPKLTIPGFKGTPKFDGFYGEMKESSIGGARGETPFPLALDIENAKEKATQILKTGLETRVRDEVPEGITIIDGASVVVMTKLTVDEVTDAQGKFSVFGEANITAIGFRESDLEAVLRSTLVEENPRAAFRDPVFVYSDVRPDFAKGTLAFSVNAEAKVISDFDVEKFTSDVLGMRVEHVRPLVENFEGSVAVKLWPPFFTKRIPGDPERVEVIVR